LLSKTDRPEGRAAAADFLAAVARDYPEDAGSLSLLGDVHRDGWIFSWLDERATVAASRRAALVEVARLERAIAAYTDAFRRDPRPTFRS
jgi:hypothetical protein